MDEPGFDRQAALVEQRDLLAAQAARLLAMADLIDKTLTLEERGIPMDKDDMFGVFGDFDPTEYEDEVARRWGDTDAYRESARRTAGYTREDWERFKAQSEAVNLAIADLMDEGVAPDDPRAMDAVEEARLLIDGWFYPCSREMHAELGRMYVADPRFTKTYERIRPGLAQYVCDATAANLERA
jgi:hypothetical protein